MTVSDSRRDRALTFLAETDSEVAELEGDVMRKEYMLDLVKDRAFLVADGNNAARQAKANTAADTLRAHEEWVQALVASKRMKAKRETERVVWETWRSENSARKAGAHP
jgi:hypothetical protein